MSQTERVIHHMETRGGITSYFSFTHYGITRLAARISDAKKQGKRIVAVPMKRRGKRFVSYRLAA
jgi:hypothetical protein